MSVTAISIQQNPVQSPATSPQTELQSLIKDVAKRCLIELAVSLAIGTTAAFFTTSSLHQMVICAAISVQTVSNAALRLADALASKMPECKETQWIHSASRYLCTTMFAYLTAFNAQILIHESGHALAATWLFQDANPEITFTPYLGGITRFSKTHLSSWGEKIGKSNAILVATLMGPACSLLVSAVAIAVGYASKGKFPELGYYLIGVGNGDFVAHSAYAMAALSSSPSSQAHDYVRLKTFGIHPIASTIAILAIPILIDRAFNEKEH